MSNKDLTTEEKQAIVDIIEGTLDSMEIELVEQKEVLMFTNILRKFDRDDAADMWEKAFFPYPELGSDN